MSGDLESIRQIIARVFGQERSAQTLNELADAVRHSIRDAALEEAAKFCEGATLRRDPPSLWTVATELRSLKGKL